MHDHGADVSAQALQNHPSIDDGSLDEKVLFFFEKGCPECEFVKEVLLGDFLERLELPPESVHYMDVKDRDVRRSLLKLENTLGFKSEAMAPILIVGRKSYCGVKEIQGAIQESRVGG